MYAIIETGGKQYKVQPGEVIEVELVDAPEGRLTFDRVLLCADGDRIVVGAPTVAKAKVTGQVLEQIRGEKLIAFKKRRRKDSQWKRGHRQDLVRVRIDEISVGG